MGIRLLNWASILRRDRTHSFDCPTLITVGRSDTGKTLVRVDYNDPDVIGFASFADRIVLRENLSRRFQTVQCNWFGKPCMIPSLNAGELWPDQEGMLTSTSDGDGPWVLWERRDITREPTADEWRSCYFCGEMICAGWQFRRYDGPNDAACSDHIVTAGGLLKQRA